MRNWLKKFEETTVGMLFSDQYLAPSEVVRIAESAQDMLRRCGTVCDDVVSASSNVANAGVTPKPATPTTHLIGLR